MLSKSDILSYDDLPKQVVDVPEWGGKLLVRALTGKERDTYEQSMFQMIGTAVEVRLVNARARLVAMACMNEDGTRMFTLEDVEALGNKNGAALDRVYQAAQEISGLTPKDIKELTENFTVSLGGALLSS